LKSIIRVIVILIAVLLPHFLPLPFNSYSLVIILMVWIFLRYDKSSFKDLGFSFSKFKGKALPYGIIV